jgi:tryptophan-rich sensory protein
MKVKKILTLFICILICELAGVIGAFSTTNEIKTWYPTLVTPWFQPPNYLFSPVWTTLFALMGISLYLVLSIGWKKKEVKKAVIVFAIQLVLNTLWSIIFFGMHQIFWGLVEIILLWISILATIILFYKIKKTAAYLLIPYILWVSFAAVLNYSIWILNR